jgi:hypothetical protein
MHPAVLNARLRQTILVGAAGVIPLVISLGIAVAVPKPNVALALALALGALGIVVLVGNSRLEVTVTILALYLGMFDGPVKLLTGGHELATGFRDVLIFAISLGAILRILAKRERVTLPPFSGWVVVFVAIVFAEAFNPSTHGILKALGGFRQQLEFVPFFFFGYVIMRSKQRFRKFFLILGVLALANGAVSLYQTKLGPAQLASWGPGYKELVFGTLEQGKQGGLAGRTYTSEGVSRVRPPGLGKDSGFGGSVGFIALPCALALLATASRRRRWVGGLLCVGALLAIVISLSRAQAVGAVFAVLAFAALSVSAGRRVTRPLIAVLAVLALTIPLAAVLVSVEAPGTFSRYAAIAPESVTSSKDKKTGELSRLPGQLAEAPLGVGLASVGAAGGFGGVVKERLNGHGVGAETQYNFVADELGIPGLVLWVALIVNVIVLATRRLRRIADIELRIELAAVFAVLVAFLLMGASVPIMASPAAGPFFWFATGIAAYWFSGPGRKSAAANSPSAA